MGILGAFIIALIVAVLFSPYKNRNSVMPLIILFMILFFAGVAAQYWIVPFGPVFMGVAWFRILFIILIFALLFSAPGPRIRGAKAETGDAAEPALTAVSIFIWLILFVLLIAVVLGVYYSNSVINTKTISELPKPILFL